MNSEPNHRVLIVDDEEVVRDSLRESLCPKVDDHSELDAAAGALFGAAPGRSKSNSLFEFAISEARNGSEAIVLVEQSQREGRPFALIFMDMRMPGSDGLETVHLIRKIEQRAEVVFVTAYSDHSIEEIIERAGPNVGYYCKPFAPEEIRQVAIKATYDWNRNQDLERLIGMVGELRANGDQMQVLFANILHQVGAVIGSSSSLIARHDGSSRLIPEIGTGQMKNTAALQTMLERLAVLLPNATFPLILPDEQLFVFQLDEYHLIAVVENDHKLDSEKFYMLKLLLESARASIENTRLQSRVREQEILSTLGQALSGIVHDLRNPVGAIQSLGELQFDSLAQGDIAESRDLLEMMMASGAEAMDLLEDTLDFTRSSNCSIGVIEVPELLSRVSERARLILENFGVAFESPTPSSITVLGDERKLLRVFVNLIKNAGEALHDNKTPDAIVTLRAEESPDFVRFSISDNGPGIPVEIQDKLFNPFFTAGKSNGTGLGLSIVRQILEAHERSIELSSRSGETTFSFTLPRPKE